MTDDTNETPEPSDATEETAAADATEIVEPDEIVEPEATAKANRERSYVRVPTWAFAAIGAIVLAGGGFLIGRATASDDHEANRHHFETTGSCSNDRTKPSSGVTRARTSWCCRTSPKRTGM